MPFHKFPVLWNILLLSKRFFHVFREFPPSNSSKIPTNIQKVNFKSNQYCQKQRNHYKYIASFSMT